MTGLELTALTNATMASNSLYFSMMLWWLRYWFPGVDNTLERAARWVAMGPLALWVHRLWWNLGIFTGAQAEHGLGWCHNPITNELAANCRYGWWATYLSASLLVPIIFGAFGAWRATLLIGPVRTGRMLAAYACLLGVSGVTTIWIV